MHSIQVIPTKNVYECPETIIRDIKRHLGERRTGSLTIILLGPGGALYPLCDKCGNLENHRFHFGSEEWQRYLQQDRHVMIDPPAPLGNSHNFVSSVRLGEPDSAQKTAANEEAPRE